MDRGVSVDKTKRVVDVIGVTDEPANVWGVLELVALFLMEHGSDVFGAVRVEEKTIVGEAVCKRLYKG